MSKPHHQAEAEGMAKALGHVLGSFWEQTPGVFVARCYRCNESARVEPKAPPGSLPIRGAATAVTCVPLPYYSFGL